MTSPRYVLYCRSQFSACASKKDIYLFQKKICSTKNYICFPKTEIYSRHLSLAILKFLHCRFRCKRLIFQQNLAEKNKEKLFIFAASPTPLQFPPLSSKFLFLGFKLRVRTEYKDSTTKKRSTKFVIDKKQTNITAVSKYFHKYILCL